MAAVCGFPSFFSVPMMSWAFMARPPPGVIALLHAARDSAIIHPMISRRCLTVLATLMALVDAVPTAAARYDVDTLAALQAKINSAAPGDVITVKDGVYTTSASIAVAG